MPQVWRILRTTSVAYAAQCEPGWVINMDMESDRESGKEIFV